MMNIRLATENRKAAATRLAEIIGGTSRYTKVPRCAYEVGPYFLEKDGTVTVPEDADRTARSRFRRTRTLGRCARWPRKACWSPSKRKPNRRRRKPTRRP